ncbi:MAG: type IV pilus modification protein PilV [Halioglobus sp.]
MSACLKSSAVIDRYARGPNRARIQIPAIAQNGVGMLEFLVALLVFSTGMMGLMSAQLAGKKASFDAAQRSVATALARDLLERMRSNPRQLAAFRKVVLGDADSRVSSPARNCGTSPCSVKQLAEFDLWQWESSLLGENEQGTDGSRGGLIAPRACISSDGSRVDIAISWQIEVSSAQVPGDACDELSAILSDETGMVDNAPAQRRRLHISTFIAGT